MSKVKICYLGHACFKISFKGYDIIIDPYKEGYVPGYLKLKEKANLVLCTHKHDDHNAANEIELKDGINNPFIIESIQTFHDENLGALRGNNTIYLLSSNECKIAHMGDIGCDLKEDEIKKLSGLDVIMIPVGGFYTIDAKKAKDILDKIKPKYIIPMHYKGRSFGYGVLSEIDEFIKLFENYNRTNSCEIILDKEDNVKGEIVVLKAKYLKQK